VSAKPVAKIRRERGCDARSRPVPKTTVALRTATVGVYRLVKPPSFEGRGPAETKAFGQGDERMERKTNTNGTEPNELATPTAMS
jgi:hypothetical protein